MLRLAIDFCCNVSDCTGTGTFSSGLVEALTAADRSNEILLFVPFLPPVTTPHECVRYVVIGGSRQQTTLEPERQTKLAKAIDQHKPDCLLAPATILPDRLPLPTISTVHDLNFLERPHYFSFGITSHLKEWALPSIRRADRVVAVSWETHASLVRAMAIEATRISVIYPSVRQIFRQSLATPIIKAQLTALGVSQPYFLHVSNLAPHKNVQFALQAFARFLQLNPRSQHLFVYAGGAMVPNKPVDPVVIARGLGILNRVRYAGVVDEEQLKALYCGCDALLFPSLNEGWGLPVAEAAATGARVLASPQVPAAAFSQRKPLDAEQWAIAMADPSVGIGGCRSPSLVETGQSWLMAVRTAIESFHSCH